MNITKTNAYNLFISSIEENNLDTILLNEKNQILIGLSGGSDSVFLFISLINLFKQNGINPSSKMFSAHINYSLRGKDSDTDQDFVKELCKKYNIILYDKKICFNSKENLEAKCRKIRFDFFYEICFKYGYNIVTLAHILEDRVENILIKLINGGSLESIVQPEILTIISNLTYIRPLLNISKKVIIESLNSINQNYRTDKTNFENDFLRNKVRNQILPIFSNIKPDWKKSAVKLIKALMNDNDYLKDKCSTLLKNHIINDKLFVIKIKDFINLHIALRIRFIINATKYISNYNTFLNQEVIYNIINKCESILKNNLSGTYYLYKDNYVSIWIEYNDLFVSKPLYNKKINPILIKINDFKKNLVEKFCKIYDYRLSYNFVRFNNNFDYKLKCKDNPFELYCYIQLKENSNYIRIRNIRNGDKIQIAKSKAKSVKKILSDLKISNKNREKSFVIETSEEIHFNSSSIVILIIYKNFDKSRINYLNHIRKAKTKDMKDFNEIFEFKLTKI